MTIYFRDDVMLFKCGKISFVEDCAAVDAAPPGRAGYLTEGPKRCLGPTGKGLLRNACGKCCSEPVGPYGDCCFSKNSTARVQFPAIELIQPTGRDCAETFAGFASINGGDKTLSFAGPNISIGGYIGIGWSLVEGGVTFTLIYVENPVGVGAPGYIFAASNSYGLYSTVWPIWLGCCGGTHTMDLDRINLDVYASGPGNRFCAASGAGDITITIANNYFCRCIVNGEFVCIPSDPDYGDICNDYTFDYGKRACNQFTGAEAVCEEEDLP